MSIGDSASAAPPQPPSATEGPERVRHPEKAHRPDNPPPRKPAWIRVKAPSAPAYHETRALMRGLNLATVCEEAACPFGIPSVT